MGEYVQLNALQNMNFSDELMGGNIVSDNIEKVKVAFEDRDYMYLLCVILVIVIAYYVIRWVYNRYFRSSMYISSVQPMASMEDDQSKYMHQITPNVPYYTME